MADFGTIRFTTSMIDGRPKGDRDSSITDNSPDDNSKRRASTTSVSYYDNSGAKLANKHEDRRLAMAIHDISLEKFRNVAGLEQDKLKVKKGFRRLQSQQQLLDVARAERAVGPDRRSTPAANTQRRSSALPSNTRRPLSCSTISPSPPRQHRRTNPTFSSHNFFTSNKITPDIRQGRQASQAHDAAQKVSRKPVNPGGHQAVTDPHSGDIIRGRIRQASPRIIRAKTATEPRRQSYLPHHAQLTSPNRDKPAQSRSTIPVQPRSALHSSVDTDDSENDLDLVSDSSDSDDNTSRPRSTSALVATECADTLVSCSNQTPRQRSRSLKERPKTAGGELPHGRSRRELSRLTHIDAITTAEMSLQRKVWLTRQNDMNAVGDISLQQRVNEFIIKLDEEKKIQRAQSLVVFDKPCNGQLALPSLQGTKH